MAEKKLNPVVFEDCRIMFRNFSGAAGRFNTKGDRNFALALDGDTAAAMLEDGWNVKHLKPREDGEDPQAFIKVIVSYKIRPPRVVVITSRGRTNLDESMIDILDWAEFTNVDLILNPSRWTSPTGDRSGVSAYLGSIYVTIREDELELKYADVPDSGQSAIMMESEIVGIERNESPRAITQGTPF